MSISLRVGLIGLGLMGRGIGLSLLRDGHVLGIVAHQKRATTEELLNLGAVEFKSPVDLAMNYDFIVTCLPSEEACRQVLLGNQGIVHSTRTDILVIECSTLMPHNAIEFSDALGRSQISFVDAPVTRGPREAELGKLNAILAGSPDSISKARPVLTSFCEGIFEVGSLGQAYAAKLINNFLAFSNLAAIGEAMATAKQANLDLRQLMAVIAVSGGQSRVLDGLVPTITSIGPSRSIVSISTAHKDVKYYSELSKKLKSAGPISQAVLAEFSRALEQDLGEELTPKYLSFIDQSQVRE
ncbi:MAG: NAD(P)-dependent oxidoreductase [Limnohabitans sp.]